MNEDVTLWRNFHIFSRVADHVSEVVTYERLVRHLDAKQSVSHSALFNWY